MPLHDATTKHGHFELDIVIRSCDLVIAISYIVIPISLLYFLAQERISVTFKNAEQDRKLLRHVTICVSAFILTCGFTHAYRFTLLFVNTQIPTVIILLLCAIISAYTAFVLVWNRNRLLDAMKKVEVSSKGTSVDLSAAFNLIVDFLADMVSVHDLDTMAFIHASDVCGAYGYNPQMLFTMPLTDIVFREDHPVLETMFMNAKNNVFYSVMFRILTADRAFVMVESTPKLGRWKNKDVLFLLTRNVQHRIEHFDKLTKVSEEMARMQANKEHSMTIAHDLRTSLSIFELAIAEMKINPSVMAIQSAELAIWFMKYIVQRTVECCRVLQGEKPRPILVNFDLATETRTVLQMLASYPKSVIMTCEFKTDETLNKFICDIEWYVSIVTSLLCNACDNTMFGSIVLGVFNDDKWLTVECIDTGIGILQGDVGRLFCPFTKLATKLKPEHGIGLGLYNCAWRVRGLGGTYSFRKNEPQGSVFSFRLPMRVLAQDAVVEEKRPSIGPQPSMFDYFKLLVVDDAIVFRKLLIRNLQKRGIKHIEEGSDGAEGLEKMKENRYDAVLIDQMMPIMNGDDTIKKYKEWEVTTNRFPQTVFILMSADVMKAGNDILSGGFIVEFLSKPISYVHLMNIFKDIVMA